MSTEYVIVETRFFYGPLTKVGLVEDPNPWNPRSMRFASEADASAWIEAARAEPYRLAHNEYDPPRYRVTRIDRLPKYLASKL